MISDDIKFSAIENGVGYGDDEWHQTATNWTITLRYNGRRFHTGYWMGSAFTRAPERNEVLESLAYDCRAGDQSFKDFCADFGYDTDSRKAEKTWKACQRMASNLERLFGADLQAFIDHDWEGDN